MTAAGESKHQFTAAYLEEAFRHLTDLKRRSYQALALPATATVLDAGCGSGVDVDEIAQLLTEGGKVIGLDVSADLLRSASERVRRPSRAECEFVQGDVCALPFADGYFDAVRCDRLLQHVEKPLVAIGEMKRVTRAGGRVVIVDTDWGTLSISSQDDELEREVVKQLLESGFANPFAGRNLRRWMQDAGLQEVCVEPAVIPMNDWSSAKRLGLFSAIQSRATGEAADRLRRWDESLEALSSTGGFFATLNIHLAYGLVAREGDR